MLRRFCHRLRSGSGCQSRSAVSASIAVAVTLWLGSSAGLASEDDRSLSVSLSYGSYRIDGKSPDGAVVGLDYERGFSDTLAFRVSGGAGAYLGDDALSFGSHMVLGFTYLFDVLKYVPYGNVGLGGIGLLDEDSTLHALPLVEVGFGLEILESRAFSYGLLTRFEGWIDRTAHFTVGGRLTWRWGYF